MDINLNELNFEQLNVLSAELHDKLYSVRSDIAQVQEFRNKKAQEIDNARPQSQIDRLQDALHEYEKEIERLKANSAQGDAGEAERYARLVRQNADLQEEVSKLKSKPTTVIVAEPIKSDEAVIGMGGALKKLFSDIFSGR